MTLWSILKNGCGQQQKVDLCDLFKSDFILNLLKKYGKVWLKFDMSRSVAVLIVDKGKVKLSSKVSLNNNHLSFGENK